MNLPTKILVLSILQLNVRVSGPALWRTVSAFLYTQLCIILSAGRKHSHLSLILQVVKSNPSEESPHMTMTLSRHHTLGKYFVSQNKPSQLQDYATNSQSPYHVRGPINQVYSEILLSRLCARKRELVST